MFQLHCLFFGFHASAHQLTAVLPTNKQQPLVLSLRFSVVDLVDFSKLSVDICMHMS